MEGFGGRGRGTASEAKLCTPLGTTRFFGGRLKPTLLWYRLWGHVRGARVGASTPH